MRWIDGKLSRTTLWATHGWTWRMCTLPWRWCYPQSFVTLARFNMLVITTVRSDVCHQGGNGGIDYQRPSRSESEGPFDFVEGMLRVPCFIGCTFWIEEIRIKMFAWDNPSKQVLNAVMKTVSLVRDRMPRKVDEGLAMLPKTGGGGKPPIL
jgi:hypothetical protein